MEDDRLGKTLAITSLYPENRIRNSRSSLCAFRRSLRETRSSLGVNSSGPYGSAEHACQRTFEYLRQLPPPRS